MPQREHFPYSLTYFESQVQIAHETMDFKHINHMFNMVLANLGRYYPMTIRGILVCTDSIKDLVPRWNELYHHLQGLSAIHLNSRTRLHAGLTPSAFYKYGEDHVYTDQPKTYHS